MLAAMIDGLSESGAASGAGASGVRARRGRRPTPAGHERLQPGLGALDHGDVLGRRRPAAVDAPPGPRQLRDRLGRQRRAGRALQGHVGRDGDHRARLRLGLGQHPDHRGPRRRRVRPQRREDLRHLRRPRRRRRGVGDARQEPGPRRDQVVRGPEGHPGHDGRAARAQARHPRLRHRDDPLRGLPGAQGEPARHAGDRRQAGLRRRDGDLRQHPPAGRRDGRRLRPRLARADPRAARAGRRRRSTTTGRRTSQSAAAGDVPAARGGLGGGATCSPSRPPGWPTTASPTRSRPRWPRPRPAASAPTSRCAASSWPAASATASTSCSRSGRATPRSSTSSRAPSRSSS